jgi:hypothetical protein
LIYQNQPCDPAVHSLCMRLARKFTDIVRPLLRQEEVGECLREAYMAAREEIEKKPGREPEL